MLLIKFEFAHIVQAYAYCLERLLARFSSGARVVRAGALKAETPQSCAFTLDGEEVNLLVAATRAANTYI